MNIKNFTKKVIQRKPVVKALSISLSFLFILFSVLSQEAEAQDGLINDDFSSGNTYNWRAATSGSTGQIVNGKFVITAALQTSGKYRGDFQKTGGVTFHAGNYPIVAIKINKPPRCNWFFDTNLGPYNNSNNNSTKIATDNGNVYYWEHSKIRDGWDPEAPRGVANSGDGNNNNITTFSQRFPFYRFYTAGVNVTF